MFERCLYFNVNALGRGVNRLWEEAFRGTGVTAAQAYLLRLALERPGIAPGELAAELRLEKSTVTRLVDGLVRKGLVIRRGATDGRGCCIEPTAAGQALQPLLEERAESLYRRMRQTLGAAEMKSLVAALREAARKLD